MSSAISIKNGDVTQAVSAVQRCKVDCDEMLAQCVKRCQMHRIRATGIYTEASHGDGHALKEDVRDKASSEGPIQRS